MMVEPTKRMRDGRAVWSRSTNQALWNLKVVAARRQDETDTVQLSLPFPQEMVTVTWKKGGHPCVTVSKLEGHSARLRGFAA